MELFYKLGEMIMIDSQNQLVTVKAEQLSMYEFIMPILLLLLSPNCNN